MVLNHGNLSAIPAPVSLQPNYNQTMASKDYDMMTAPFSKPEMENASVYTSSNPMHIMKGESNCVQGPCVSRNFNGAEASPYLWPAWVNYPSSPSQVSNGKGFLASQNSAFKSYPSFGLKGVGGDAVRIGSTDVAEALTLLGESG